MAASRFAATAGEVCYLRRAFLKFSFDEVRAPTLQHRYSSTNFGDNLDLVRSNLMGIKPFVKHGRAKQLEGLTCTNRRC